MYDADGQALPGERQISSRQLLRQEWRAVTAVILFALGLVFLPYLLGYLLTPADKLFTGLVMNPEDSQSYFAKIRQGYDGQWLYTIPFTPEAHEAEFLGGFYLALGHLARRLGLSMAAIWHLARAGADIFLFLSLYHFVNLFLTESRQRWTAYLLAIFGSGFGWLLFLLNQPDWLGAFPVDFKMPGAHLFFSAMTFPHVAFGTALLFVSLALLQPLVASRPPFESARRSGLRVLAAGFVHLLLGITYPFLIYLVIAIAALYWLFQVGRVRLILWRSGFLLAATFLIPAPLFVYYASVLQTNAVFRAWDVQAVTPSPPWPHYLVAFGPMLLLAVLPLWRRRPIDRRQVLLWLWVLAAAVLVYAPLNPQRRFVQGLQAPLAILAAAGLWQVVLPAVEQTAPFKRLAARPRYSAAGLQRLLVTVFLLFMALSNLYVLASVSLTTAVEQPYPFFRSLDEQAAVAWLRANSDRTDVVLAAYETGNYVAAQAGNRVVIGHWAETVDWADKFAQVDAFFDLSAEAGWRHTLLDQYDVQYIWYGPRERDLGDFNLAVQSYWQPVFNQGDVTIYAVRP